MVHSAWCARDHGARLRGEERSGKRDTPRKGAWYKRERGVPLRNKERSREHVTPRGIHEALENLDFRRRARSDPGNLEPPGGALSNLKRIAGAYGRSSEGPEKYEDPGGGGERGERTRGEGTTRRDVARLQLEEAGISAQGECGKSSVNTQPTVGGD